MVAVWMSSQRVSDIPSNQRVTRNEGAEKGAWVARKVIHRHRDACRLGCRRERGEFRSNSRLARRRHRLGDEPVAIRRSAFVR